MSQSNDLNSFRSGISMEHDQFQEGMMARKDSYLQNITQVKEGFTDKLNVLKDQVGQAETMLKTGLESEAGVVGSHIAGKVAIGAYRYVKGTHDIHGNMTDEYAQSIKDAAGNPEVQPDTVNNPTAPSEIARPTGGSNEGDGPSTEMGVRDPNVATNQYTRDQYDPKTGLKSDPQEVPTYDGETKSSDAFDALTKDDGTGAKFDFDGATDPLSKIPSTSRFAGETKTNSSTANAAEGSGDSGTGGTANSLDNLGDSASGALDDGLDTAAKAAAKAAADAVGDAALDAAATAFSWVPFVGEILGAGAAIAGIGTAIAGAVETVSGDAAENATQKAADIANAAAAARKPQQSSGNYAGGYVAPTVSSIQQ